MSAGQGRADTLAITLESPRSNSAIAATAGGASGSRDVPSPGPFSENRTGWLILAAVWLICAIYTGMRLRTGWYTWDAGMLSQMAERVLNGQVPHRDFVEVYTGGLTYLNALAFRLFGVNFFSLRIPLFLCFLGWVPAAYFAARRFVAPVAGGMVTLLAVAWSVPSYPEGMPIWYDLFFASWGVLALLRYAETERRRWLWVAGLCGGLSFLFKITALYFVAAALLFFVFRELSLCEKSSGGSRGGGLPYRLFASAGLLVFLAALVGLVSGRPTAGNYLQFVVPSAVLVGFLLWKLWSAPSDGSSARFRRLFSMAAPFLAGAAVPVGLFLLWYAHLGALGEWFHGTFLGGAAHIRFVGIDTNPVAVFVGLIPAALVTFLALAPGISGRPWARYGSALLLGGLLFVCARKAFLYFLIGYSLPWTVFVAAAAAAALLLRHPAARIRGQQVFLAASAAVTFALVQFPTAGENHFASAFPLALLALLALVPALQAADEFCLASLALFYLAFALWLGTPGYLAVMHAGLGERISTSRLRLARAGGLQIRANEAEEYEQLIPVLRAHAKGGYTYCTADCPEVYFLAGLQNPTRTILDFLDPDYLDPAYRAQRVLSDLREHNVNVVALRTGGLVLSGRPAPDLRAAIAAEYPGSKRVGDFEVRWKP